MHVARLTGRGANTHTPLPVRYTPSTCGVSRREGCEYLAHRLATGPDCKKIWSTRANVRRPPYIPIPLTSVSDEYCSTSHSGRLARYGERQWALTRGGSACYGEGEGRLASRPRRVFLRHSLPVRYPLYTCAVSLTGRGCLYRRPALWDARCIHTVYHSVERCISQGGACLRCVYELGLWITGVGQRAVPDRGGRRLQMLRDEDARY